MTSVPCIKILLVMSSYFSCWITSFDGFTSVIPKMSLDRLSIELLVSGISCSCDSPLLLENWEDICWSEWCEDGLES